MYTLPISGVCCWLCPYTVWSLGKISDGIIEGKHIRLLFCSVLDLAPVLSIPVVLGGPSARLLQGQALAQITKVALQQQGRVRPSTLNIFVPIMLALVPSFSGKLLIVSCLQGQYFILICVDQQGNGDQSDQLLNCVSFTFY